MHHHLHAIIAFKNSPKKINSIIGDGKRFMAYELVNLLQQAGKGLILYEMQQMVNKTDAAKNKIHEVFEPSFDWKECRTIEFVQQKLKYIHYNPCKCNPRLAAVPEDYTHSSAKFYITYNQGVYLVTSFMELQDIDLSS